jgi:hypothetical protein
MPEHSLRPVIESLIGTFLGLCLLLIPLLIVLL